jgi:hypothetical protein
MNTIYTLVAGESVSNFNTEEDLKEFLFDECKDDFKRKEHIFETYESFIEDLMTNLYQEDCRNFVLNLNNI